jgi:hypothetical protein
MAWATWRLRQRGARQDLKQTARFGMSLRRRIGGIEARKGAPALYLRHFWRFPTAARGAVELQIAGIVASLYWGLFRLRRRVLSRVPLYIFVQPENSAQHDL